MRQLAGELLEIPRVGPATYGAILDHLNIDPCCRGAHRSGVLTVRGVKANVVPRVEFPTAISVFNCNDHVLACCNGHSIGGAGACVFNRSTGGDPVYVWIAFFTTASDDNRPLHIAT